MKKLLAIVAISALAVSTAQAQELKVKDVVFSSGDFDVTPIISLDLKNNTSQNIVAFKGTIVCLDAFDDEAIKLNVTDRSANLPAGDTGTFSWKANMFGDAGQVILNNDAKNFRCSLTNLNVVN